jgi:hypothetical protein
VVSRILPLLLAGCLAGWARWRLKLAFYRPTVLVALVAGSLGLRLVFEVNLYDYYFMALCVGLVTLDMVVGKLRRATIVWIFVAAAFFPPVYDRLVSIGTVLALPLHLAIAASGVAIALWPVIDLRGSLGHDPAAPLPPGPPPYEPADLPGG